MVDLQTVRRLEDVITIGNVANRVIECQMYVHGKDAKVDDPAVLVYITCMADIDSAGIQNPMITDLEGNSIDTPALRAEIMDYLTKWGFQHGADLRVLTTVLENAGQNIAYAAHIAEFVEEGTDDAAAWLAIQPEDQFEEACIALGMGLRGYHRYFHG